MTCTFRNVNRSDEIRNCSLTITPGCALWEHYSFFFFSFYLSFIPLTKPTDDGDNSVVVLLWFYCLLVLYTAYLLLNLPSWHRLLFYELRQDWRRLENVLLLLDGQRP